ncbi:putative ADP-ribose pyrophosphatase NudF [Proteus penneri ATCC 35198]|nr:putative ADP-ribose pyrophosphatase NudF [Proteus penneri ATCC 35198]
MKKRENTPFLYGREDVKLLNQKDLYKGFFRMTEYRFKHRLFLKADGVKKSNVKSLSEAMRVFC